MLSRLLGRNTEQPLEWKLVPLEFDRNSIKEQFSGKVNLPQDCLVDLVQKQKETPYAFKILSQDGLSHIHVGVQDFTADPGTVVLPTWMHRQLGLDKSAVTVTFVTLPRGVFVKLLPQDKRFLEVENPKAELESALREYQVLSKGDTIELYFEGEFQSMSFTIAETRPDAEGISIIDTDLEVDFLPPTGYTEEARAGKAADFLATAGSGEAYLKHPLDPSGKKKALGVAFIS